jgi:DNA polymerase I
MEDNKLIYGKAKIDRIVGLEVDEDLAEIFQQDEDGTIRSIFVNNRFWLLANNNVDGTLSRLDGDLHYKYGKQFLDRKTWARTRSIWQKYNDIFSIWNQEEAAMVKDGYCFYQGMQPKDVSILSWDMETTGLDPSVNDAKIILITTTYRNHKQELTRKQFVYNEYQDQKEMIEAFCKYVLDMNPSLIMGHNIIPFDFMYLEGIANKVGASLVMGRNNSKIKFDGYESKYRLDGTRDLMYRNVQIYGREIVDTFFLSMKWDVSKEMESYGLKPLIKQLGLEKEGRQFYDANTIRFNYKDPNELAKIIEYGKDDADDAIKLWDKMGTPFFYSANYVPKPFGELLMSATGAQINSILIRSYLQDRHSLPKTTDTSGKVEGGISFGVPGIYSNVLKVDLKSAYPSQILRFKIYDKEKDPKGHFYEVVKYFTEQRFVYKQKSKETGDQYWMDLDATGKIFINSAYGTLNTAGLLFNSPNLAAMITRETRKVIDLALTWASGLTADHWITSYGNKEFEEMEEDES